MAENVMRDWRGRVGGWLALNAVSLRRLGVWAVGVWSVVGRIGIGFRRSAAK